MNKVNKKYINYLYYVIYYNIPTNLSYIICINNNGDWGLGIGDWGLGPIPNPQSPIPNPQ